MNNQKGLTLIEITIAGALLGGLLLIAAELIKRVKSGTKTLQNKEVQMNMQATRVQLLRNELKGLKSNELDHNLLYKLNSSNKSYSRSSSSVSDGQLMTYQGGSGLGTSFIYRKRFHNRFLDFISVCIPTNQALSTNIKFEDLQKNKLWTFIREDNRGYQVYCCPRNQPMCEDKLAGQKNLVAQVYQHDPKDGSVTPVLKKGELSSVTSIGFFIFADSNAPVIHGRFFTFFNDCLSRKIVTGKMFDSCHDRDFLVVNQVSEEFSFEVENINELGNSIGL